MIERTYLLSIGLSTRTPSKEAENRAMSLYRTIDRECNDKIQKLNFDSVPKLLSVIMTRLVNGPLDA